MIAARPVARREPEGAVAHRCPLCGGTFAEEAHCGVCPMSRHCRILCCPHCGYSFVETSAIVTLFRRVMRRLRGHEPSEAEAGRG